MGVDVYSAVSWDRLHAYHGGLFSDHLLEELKSVIEESPRRKMAIAIDEAYVLIFKLSDNSVLIRLIFCRLLFMIQFFLNSLASIPSWSGLNHFTMLKSTGEFADGTKYEDLSKVSETLLQLFY